MKLALSPLWPSSPAPASFFARGTLDDGWAWHRALRREEAQPDRPAVFIDKDGTLVEEMGDDIDPQNLRFLPAACEALAALATAGFALVLVSNESGLALGRFTRAEFARLQDALKRSLREQSGVELLDFLVCPHAPAFGGKPACLCRKPAAGLITRAARMHRIDAASSWMVGDSLDDIEAGNRAGCRTVLLERPGASRRPASPMRTPHACSSSWGDIAHLVLGEQMGLSIDPTHLLL